MKLSLWVVLVTKDAITLERVMRYCSLLKKPLLVVNAGLESFPKPPNKAIFQVVDLSLGDSTVSAALNRGLTVIPGSDVLLLTDSNANDIVNLEMLETVFASGVRVGILHADKNEIPGTRQVPKVPILGSILSGRALQACGLLDGSLRDLSMVSQSWCERAASKGWSSVLTKGLPTRELKSDLADRPLKVALSQIDFLKKTAEVDIVTGKQIGRAHV